MGAIPKYLLLKARNLDDFLKSVYLQLLNGHELNLDKIKTKEFYWILNEQNPTPLPTGPEKWKKPLNAEMNEWQTFFKSARKICKENKLREFQFKFLHRVVVTKKELFGFGIKQDSLFCGEKDSIDHTFINCQFSKSFRESVFRWFNSKNNSNLLPSLKESLFGLTENLPNNSRLSAKLNYTLLFMRFYIYSCKLHRKALTLSDFANQVEIKYQLEKL